MNSATNNTAPATIATLSGDTYPLRSILKKLGYSWDADSKTWTCTYTKYGHESEAEVREYWAHLVRSRGALDQLELTIKYV